MSKFFDLSTQVGREAFAYYVYGRLYAIFDNLTGTRKERLFMARDHLRMELTPVIYANNPQDVSRTEAYARDSAWTYEQCCVNPPEYPEGDFQSNGYTYRYYLWLAVAEAISIASETARDIDF